MYPLIDGVFMAERNRGDNQEDNWPDCLHEVIIIVDGQVV